MTSVQQIMAAKATMAGTLVMAPKSVRFQRHVCAFWRFAQPFLQHYIFNVFVSCQYCFFSKNYKPTKVENKIINVCVHISRGNVHLL